MRTGFINLVAVILALASCIGSATAAPPTLIDGFSPKRLSGQCAEIYRDWATQLAPKAFALSADGVDCGAAWAHATAEEARAEALVQCTGSDVAGCAVVAEDATPPVSVQVGDVLLIHSCAGDYNNWLEQGAPKSFYSTADGTSCGAAWNYETLQRASKEARRLCVSYGDPCQEIGAVE